MPRRGPGGPNGEGTLSPASEGAPVRQHRFPECRERTHRPLVYEPKTLGHTALGGWPVVAAAACCPRSGPLSRPSLARAAMDVDLPLAAFRPSVKSLPRVDDDSTVLAVGRSPALKPKAFERAR